MPIFTSRFSSERSLVGSIATSRIQESKDAESKDKNRRTDSANSRTSQKATTDRLEITNNQQDAFAALFRSSEKTVDARADKSAADAQVARQLTLRKASQETVVARSNLSSSPQELPIGVSASNNTQSASIAQQTTITKENFSALQSALTNRLDTLVKQLNNVRAQQSVRANAKENTTAAQNATPESLDALTQSVAQPTPSTPTSIRDDEVAVDPTARLEARIEKLRDKKVELASAFVPPAPPKAEEQKAELRTNLQAISTGLQNDAAIEKQRNASETQRNADVVAKREQRQTIRENQSEISNLQVSRRQLDQEAQRTDQAIRQLQNETARLKNGATSSGTALNILAQ
jgi:hypothetical protein